MTKAQVVIMAQELGVKMNTQLLGSGNSPVVILLALRMFDKTLTASIRQSPDMMALVSELWGIVEPEVDAACVHMGMAPGAD